MKSSVYDTMLVAKANGSIAGRRCGNILDRRLALLEDAVNRVTTTLVNAKLLHEYGVKIRDVEIRNETVRAFLLFAIDYGLNSGRSTLTRSDWDKAQRARWPAHDQHLLAAAVGRRHVSIYITEKRHAACKAAIRREFSITIVEIP